MIRSTIKSCTSRLSLYTSVATGYSFSKSCTYLSNSLFPGSHHSFYSSGIANYQNYNDNSIVSNKKYYSLSQFPYPSGNLHMGHVRVYTMSDCIARLKRMQGYEVVHPMGWDAFGLPAENAAIDKQVSPALWTNQNIEQMTEQLKRLDLQFDWEREVSTCSPDYYRWTQEIFLRLYEKGLAYRKHSPVNWDPIDQTVLANEQVDSQGRSWRSNAIVERREMKQWYFKITEYADRLADDLEKLTGWPEEVKSMQREWIGRSVGALVDFKFAEMKLTAFTTRPETLFGVTFLSVHYKHPILERVLQGGLIDSAKKQQLKAVIEKIKMQQESPVPASNGDDPELVAFDTTVEIDTPVGTKLHLVVASTVLPDYGTGVVMGVPGHNPVDHDIAKLLNLPIRHVLTREAGDESNSDLYDNKDATLINSGQFNSLTIKESIAKMIKDNVVTPSKSYRIRDWLLSRQRYWGTPIPIIHCDSCGEVPVPKEQLPVKLPTDIEFTGKGNLLNSLTDWKNCKCPKCNGSAVRETDTMDTFVDSSWYYMRFLDSQNQKEMFNKDIVNRMMPVDVYVGGIEHAILHLLYSRFFTKFLKDQGLIDHEEPFKVLLTQGLVKSPTYRDSTTNKPLYPKDVDFSTPKPISKLTGNLVNITLEKMSKSKLNGIDPNEMIDKYGSDTLKLYVLFKAPPENSLEWDTDGIEGCRKWLKRVESLVNGYVAERNDGQIVVADKWNAKLNALRYDTHSSIEKVTESIERYTFNTAISFLMTLSNSIGKYQTSEMKSSREYAESLESLVVLLAPFAPNAAQQLWTELASLKLNNNNSESISAKVQKHPWPVASKECLALQQKTLVIQFNGKVKSVINVQSDQQSELETIAKDHMKDKMSKFDISKTFFSTTKAGYSLNFILIPKK